MILLSNDILDFPSYSYASEEGLLAVGGDLSLDRLKTAYSHGIFPWYDEDSPILWWFPNPRAVLLPSDLKVSKSMRSLIRKQTYTVTVDTAFRSVLENCAKARPAQGQLETWLIPEMVDAYCDFHEAGFAHSVEVWDEGELVGGLYGVAMGDLFFGESMFHKKANASKYGFILLVKLLEQKNYRLIDCQIHSDHLESLGAIEIASEEFIGYLHQGSSQSTRTRFLAQLYGRTRGSSQNHIMDFIHSIDYRLLEWINNGLSSPVLDLFFQFMRTKTNWIPLYLLAAVFLIYRYKWKGVWSILLLLACVAIADQMASHLIKPWIMRIRPCHLSATELGFQLNEVVRCGSGFSFVSAHATNHFAIATAASIYSDLTTAFLAPLLFLWAGSIALAQVYVGVHFPSDVLVGALLGVSISSILLAFLSRNYRLVS